MSRESDGVTIVTGFGKPNTNSGDACVSYYVELHTCSFFLVTLMLVHVSSKKKCL